MAGLIRGDLGTRGEADAVLFFERHLAPWAERFFKDLEVARAARFYRPVGTVGRLFMEIETRAWAMTAPPEADPPRSVAVQEQPRQGCER
jgi:TorA maturation chaperone TorD